MTVGSTSQIHLLRTKYLTNLLSMIRTLHFYLVQMNPNSIYKSPSNLCSQLSIMKQALKCPMYNTEVMKLPFLKVVLPMSMMLGDAIDTF